MPAGAVGSVWAEDSWLDTAWEAGAWSAAQAEAQASVSEVYLDASVGGDVEMAASVGAGA